MPVNTKTLVKIAAIGGIITCTTGMAMQWKVKERIRTSEFYKQAFETLHAHDGAVDLLGKPIKEGSFSLRNKSNFCDRNKAHFEVLVKGTKQKGVLYFWAAKPEDSDKWNVNRVELGLEKEPDRRLLIKGDDKSENTV